MKAILVVDIPDDFKFKKAFADITLFDGKHNMWKRITEVKPMPEFRDEHYKTFSIELSQIINSENRGYNDCLREILGEEE